MIPTARRSLPFLLPCFLLTAAVSWAADNGPDKSVTASVKPDPAAYRKEIEAWRKERFDGLKNDEGWLTLVGLYWLKPGENRFGSDAGNAVVLPPGKAPAVAGVLTREGDKVTVKVEPGVALTADGKEVAPGTSVAVNAGDKPAMLRLGSLTFFVIQRGDRVGVRVKDKESALRASFHGLDNYPIRPEWRIVARFEPAKDKKIPIANIIGQVEDNPSPGAVVFDWKGKTYRIDALEGSPEGSLFLVFGDLTNGKETYGAGRFLDTDPPKDGKVVVDFNTAYNPPCAFTSFATCPLPPPQNKLSVRIEAGEKKFAGGPHE